MSDTNNDHLAEGETAPHTVEGHAEELPPEATPPPPVAVAAPGQALAVSAGPATPALYLEDPSNPRTRLEVAARYATEIADVIKRQKLATSIKGKEHVEIGGWQVAGTICKVAADIVEFGPLRNPVTGNPDVTEYDVKVTDYEWVDGANGRREKRPKAERFYTVKGYDWTAKAVAKLPDGTVVGSSSAIVRRTEDKWAKDDDTALLGMAQTRASSRAYRGALGWIMHLGGYSTTPAEDMRGPRDRGPGQEGPPLGPPANKELVSQAGPALAYLVGDDRVAEKVWGQIKKAADGYMPKAIADTIVATARGAKAVRDHQANQDGAAQTAAPAQTPAEAAHAAVEATDGEPQDAVVVDEPSVTDEEAQAKAQEPGDPSSPVGDHSAEVGRLLEVAQAGGYKAATLSGLCGLLFHKPALEGLGALQARQLRELLAQARIGGIADERLARAATAAAAEADREQARQRLRVWVVECSHAASERTDKAA